jgi:hypothetical protein
LATYRPRAVSVYFGGPAVAMDTTEGQDGSVRASEVLLDVLRVTGQVGAAGEALMTSECPHGA